MDETRIVVPDLGETSEVEVVEILVSPGDRVGLDDPVIVLESDKASMDLPSPAEGVVTSVEVSIGDRVAAGAVLVGLDTGSGAGVSAAAPDAPAAAAPETGTDDGGVEAPAPAAAAPKPEARNGRGRSSPSGRATARRGTGTGSRAAHRDRRRRRRPSRTTSTSARRWWSSGRGRAATPPPSGPPISASTRCSSSGIRPSAGSASTSAASLPRRFSAPRRRWPRRRSIGKRGVDFGAPAIDAAKLDTWKNGVVRRLTDGLAGLAKRRKVEVVQGTGRFEGPRVIAVETPEGGRRRIGFEHAIIAAGSKPVRLPDFPWDDPRVVDSTGALDITEIPRRLLVVGGGIIGLEMASVYDALGSQVTVVELLDELLAGCDRDIVRPLEKRIASRYHAIRLGTRITSVEPQRRGIKVWFGDESRIYDRVLVAVGRVPCEVDAGAAGVAVDERGFIPVDEGQRTNVRTSSPSGTSPARRSSPTGRPTRARSRPRSRPAARRPSRRP